MTETQTQSAEDFLSDYGPQTQVTVPTGTASADDFLNQYSSEPATGTSGHLPETPEWGALAETANGLLLGGGPYIEAAGRFVRGGGKQSYSDILSHVQDTKKGYEQNHPLLAPALGVAGSLPTVGLATAALPELTLPAAAGKAGILGARVANAGLAGGTAGALQTGVTGGDLGENTLTGAGIGGAFPLAGAALRPLVQPVVDNGIAAAASAAEKLGVRLRAGQLAPGLKKADTLLASGGNTQQLKDFTRAASRTIGEDTESLTPEIHQQALDRIGKDLDTSATQIKVNYNTDPSLHTDLSKILSDIDNTPGLGKADKASVREVIEDIRTSAMHNNGELPGGAYRAITQSGSLLQNLADNANGNVRKAGGDIADKLFDALQRSSSPDAVSNLTALKNQYRAAMQLRPAVKAAGPSGLLDPKKLSGKASSGDLKTLGDVSKLLPSPDALGSAKTPHSPLSLPLKIAAGGVTLEAGHELWAALQDPHMLALATGVAATALGARSAGRGIMESSGLRNLVLGKPIVSNPLVGSTARAAVIGGVNSQ